MYLCVLRTTVDEVAPAYVTVVCSCPEHGGGWGGGGGGGGHGPSQGDVAADAPS